MTLRIAMWSGPRNISTAMMRAWENRPDCAVVDEPLYASYLAATGIDHPMREEVLASQPRTYREAVAAIIEAPCETPIQYQKHMTHHLPDDMDLGWLDGLRHAFLIREPRRVVASYAGKRAQPRVDDLGYRQQVRLFDHLLAQGQQPPVILAEDVLRDPRVALTALCAALAVPFEESMLRWPAGPRDSDGVWASHWYGSVWRSTGFEAPDGGEPELSPELAAIARRCEPHFERLYRRRLRLAGPRSEPLIP